MPSHVRASSGLSRRSSGSRPRKTRPEPRNDVKGRFPAISLRSRPPWYLRRLIEGCVRRWAAFSGAQSVLRRRSDVEPLHRRGIVRKPEPGIDRGRIGGRLKDARGAVGRPIARRRGCLRARSSPAHSVRGPEKGPRRVQRLGSEQPGSLYEWFGAKLGGFGAPMDVTPACQAGRCCCRRADRAPVWALRGSRVGRPPAKSLAKGTS